MRFAFIVKHCHIWPVSWLCDVLEVSRSGFHALGSVAKGAAPSPPPVSPSLKVALSLKLERHYITFV